MSFTMSDVYHVRTTEKDALWSAKFYRSAQGTSNRLCWRWQVDGHESWKSGWYGDSILVHHSLADLRG